LRREQIPRDWEAAVQKGLDRRASVDAPVAGGTLGAPSRSEFICIVDGAKAGEDRLGLTGKSQIAVALKLEAAESPQMKLGPYWIQSPRSFGMYQKVGQFQSGVDATAISVVFCRST